MSDKAISIPVNQVIDTSGVDITPPSDLVKRIRENGGLTAPIVVTKQGESTYHLVTGQNRLAAVKALGMSEILAVIDSPTTPADMEMTGLDKLLEDDEPAPPAEKLEPLANPAWVSYWHVVDTPVKGARKIDRLPVVESELGHTDQASWNPANHPLQGIIWVFAMTELKLPPHNSEDDIGDPSYTAVAIEVYAADGEDADDIVDTFMDLTPTGGAVKTGSPLDRHFRHQPLNSATLELCRYGHFYTHEDALPPVDNLLKLGVINIRHLLKDWKPSGEESVIRVARN